MVVSSLDGEYGERLSTFTSLLYPNHKPVTAQYCARYGWRCVERDLMRCVCCGRYLSCALPPPSSVMCYGRYSKKLRGDVEAAHKDTCKFHSNPTPILDCCPNVEDNEIALHELQERYDSIADHVAQLVHCSVAEPFMIMNKDEFDSLMEFMKRNRTHAEFSDLNVVHKRALLLALCGWTGRKAKAAFPALTCDYCMRKAPLWLFCRNETSVLEINAAVSDALRSDHSSRTPPFTSVQRIRAFNPVDQHERWCPWVTDDRDELPSVIDLVQESRAEQLREATPAGTEEDRDTETQVKRARIHARGRWRRVLACAIARPPVALEPEGIPLSEYYIAAKQLLMAAMGHGKKGFMSAPTSAFKTQLSADSAATDASVPSTPVLRKGRSLL